MAVTFVKLWDEVVVRMQAFAADPSSRIESNLMKLEQGLDEHKKLPPATAHAWQRLVDSKVRRLQSQCHYGH